MYFSEKTIFEYEKNIVQINMLMFMIMYLKYLW